MLTVKCSGAPYEIGHTHGSGAKAEVARSIAFYSDFFELKAKLAWDAVRDVAARDFVPTITSQWPAFMEEMRGVADGAGVTLYDIVALNVRTEVAYGLFASAKPAAADGCTTISWDCAYLAQNWDWQEAQKMNLIDITIAQPGKPTIRMVTEAGIIGKIGLNSAGVAVTLNAILAPGLDTSRLPVHLALRSVLESPTREAAVSWLCATGVAASSAITVADVNGVTMLECSSCAVLALPELPRMYHTNHYLIAHPGVTEVTYLLDSIPRLRRIRQLCEELAGRLKLRNMEPSIEEIRMLFGDEDGFPRSINRKGNCTNKGDSSTLFNIIYDLQNREAHIAVGRPTEPEELILWEFT